MKPNHIWVIEANHRVTGEYGRQCWNYWTKNDARRARKHLETKHREYLYRVRKYVAVEGK